MKRNESKASIWSSRSSASVRCRFSFDGGDYNTWKKEGTLDSAMMEALIYDRVDIVKDLLENDFAMKTFLTISRLEDLYNTRQGPQNTLRYLVRDTKKRDVPSSYRYTMLDIGCVVEDLMEGAYRSAYCRKRFRQKYNALKRNSIVGSMGKVVTTMPMLMDTHGAQELFPHPYNDLLIWAVLMKRQQMAMYLWRQGEEPMAKALLACKLNKAMASEADRYDLEVDISDGLRSNAKEFMSLSLELLEYCYKIDDAYTQHLLTYELKNFSNQTCISLAVASNHRKFVAHRCCQVLLNDMWMGGLRTRKNSNLKVVLGILLPLSIPMLEFKSKEELKLMPQTMEEHMYELQTQGIYDRRVSISEEIITDCVNESFQADDTSGETHYTNATPSPAISINPSFHIGPSVPMQNGSATVSSPTTPDSPFGIVFNAEEKKKSTIRLDKKFYEFYNAPITKFWMYTMTYLMFLICYSYVVLVRTYKEPKWQECIVMMYVAATALEKVRHIIASEPVSITKKLNQYFSQLWNIWDTMALVIFALAVTLRFIPRTVRDARIIYTINIVFWYMRILQIISVNKYLGPYIQIMAKLFRDMLYFTVIMFIVVITFGIVRQSIHFQHEEPDWKLVRNVFFYPYWMIYGELFAHEIDTCYDDANHPDGCTYGSFVAPAFMCVYLLIIYVLLVNMLIARFNATFIANNHYVKEIWKFQKYQLVMKYKLCPSLPAPLVFINHIFLTVRFLVRRCRGKNDMFDNGLKLFLPRKDTKRLHKFETQCMEDYFQEKEFKFRSSADERIRNIDERTDKMRQDMDGEAEKEQGMALSLQTTNERMSNLEEISARTAETLQALRTLLDLGVQTFGANGFAKCVGRLENSTPPCEHERDFVSSQNGADAVSLPDMDNPSTDRTTDSTTEISVKAGGSETCDAVIVLDTEVTCHVGKEENSVDEVNYCVSLGDIIVKDTLRADTENVRVRRVSA